MKKILILFMTIFALAACSNTENKDYVSQYEDVEWDLIPMIYIDDELYLYSGEEKYYDEVTDFDGEIDSEVDSHSEPSKNNQSNFGTGYKYKILDDGKTIKLYIDDNNLIIFEKEKLRKSKFY